MRPRPQAESDRVASVRAKKSSRQQNARSAGRGRGGGAGVSLGGSIGPPKPFDGVIQGGGERELRQECAEALLEIGFDGLDEPSQQSAIEPVFSSIPQGERPRVIVPEAELAAHESRLVALRKKSSDRCLWDAAAL